MGTLARHSGSAASELQSVNLPSGKSAQTTRSFCSESARSLIAAHHQQIPAHH